jgi:hypothetical protein
MHADYRTGCASSAGSIFCPTASTRSPRGARAGCGPARSDPIWRSRAPSARRSSHPSRPASPRLQFGTVADWWLARFEAKVAASERRERTLESHRYHLEHHLLPALAARRMSALTVDDVARLLDRIEEPGLES